jgi:hypothetical protein
MPKTRLLIAATLLLAACDTKPQPEANSVEAPLPEAPVPENKSGASAQAPTNETTGNFAAKENGAAAHAITAAFHGRWGLVPGDCGPDASIAKGLMVVDAEKLRFYESVGKPAVVTWPAPNRMEGRFTFSGEGMEWSKDMVLLLKDDKTLVRTEKDPEQSFTYTRCKG